MTARRFLLLTGAALGVAALVRRWRGSAPPPEVLSPHDVRSLYDRLAPVYDVVAAGYEFVGADRFHRRAVEALALRPGETVVDLGCGTGANLAPLARAVGPTGRVVGVDLSSGMLARARDRVERHGWTNVELVQSDVRTFAFPESVHGVVSTYALEMVPEHDAVVGRALSALAPGRRIAVGGLRRPEGWPEWLIRLGELLNRPFGVSRAYEDVRPWHALRKRTEGFHYEESFFGAVYLAVGMAPARGITQEPAPSP